MVMEAVLWIVRTGSPWRDLPKGFDKWDSVFQRCRRWYKAGRFAGIFAEISGEPDTGYAIVNGSIVKVPIGGVDSLPVRRCRPFQLIGFLLLLRGRAGKGVLLFTDVAGKCRFLAFERFQIATQFQQRIFSTSDTVFPRTRRCRFATICFAGVIRCTCAAIFCLTYLHCACRRARLFCSALCSS